MTQEPLITPCTNYIEGRCWQCDHTVTLTPDQLLDGITQTDFERKARCKCGAGWAQVETIAN